MTDVIAGRFALCDPIARGGSGVVWRAYDRKIGRYCAAKVLRRRDAGDLLRFVREQSVRMSHEHVLTPYSWAAEDAHVVIASELVEGGSVTTLINDYGPLAEPTVAAMLDQLLLALEQVHAAGLIHRDVKPANLLLRATGTGPIQVLLSDFGLAIGASDAHLTEVGTVVGTPGYLAPEILRGGVSPEPRHDLYAAGRVAAALASGAEPTLVGQPTDLSGFRPGQLRDAVAALAAHDAQYRPPTAHDARALLRGVLIDAVPRTRDGDPVEVLNQLPPMTDAGFDAAGERASVAAGTAPLPTTSLATPNLATPNLAVTNLATPNLAVTNPQAEARFGPEVTPPMLSPHLPTAALSTPDPRHRRERRPGRRRGLLLATAAAVVAAAVAVPVAINLGKGDPTTPTVRTPTSTPTRTTGGTYRAPTVVAGQTCSFTDEGLIRRTATRKTVSCTTRDDGRSYVWTTK